MTALDTVLNAITFRRATVPFNSIKFDPKKNPRRSVVKATIAGLADSIKADGQLQPLLVEEITAETFDLVFGGRRYRAMQLLIKGKHWAKDAPTEVIIVPRLSAADRARLAAVENAQREDLHPLDACDAFAAMRDAGETIENIAAKSGFSAMTIKRRLALADLCPEARTALRNDTISLVHAEALTVGTAEQQRKLLERKSDFRNYGPSWVKDQLVSGRIPVSVALFDVSLYTGTLTQDLFKEEDASYFDDREQFFVLQQAAVAADVEKIKAEGAPFVYQTDDTYFSPWHFPKAEEGAEAGVVINLSPRTGIATRLNGIARNAEYEPTPEGGPEDETNEDEDEARSFHGASSAPVAKVKPEYSQGLSEILASHKSLAVQHALLSAPQMAKVIACVSMMGGINDAPYANRPIQATESIGVKTFSRLDEKPAAYSAFEAAGAVIYRSLVNKDLPKFGSVWNEMIHERRSGVGTYFRVRALSEPALDNLFCYLVAITVGQALAQETDTTATVFNAIGHDLAVDMRMSWRPDEVFLKGQNKAKLIDIALASGASIKLVGLDKMKKGELVAILAEYFQTAQTADTSDEAYALGRAWLPASMEFTGQPSMETEPADVGSGDPEADALDGIEPLTADPDATEAEGHDAAEHIGPELHQDAFVGDEERMAA